MKYLTVIVVFLLLTGCNTMGGQVAVDRACQGRDKSATFGVDGRNEDYLRGCFPCCFCCGPDGDCCDSCNDNNSLAVPQLPSDN